MATRKFRKQVNNLIVCDSSPRLWREVSFQVKRGTVIFEEFSGGEKGKQKAIDWATKQKDFLVKRSKCNETHS